MSASLVGSEMCIRDSTYLVFRINCAGRWSVVAGRRTVASGDAGGEGGGCLLYTSDAADDM
eukprot:1229732-Alexandrium_andersonii.AAC.1